jgi:hypothetical protein
MASKSGSSMDDSIAPIVGFLRRPAAAAPGGPEGVGDGLGVLAVASRGRRGRSGSVGSAGEIFFFLVWKSLYY